MKKKSLLWISVFLLMLAGCSSDDDNNMVYSKNLIVGEWSASHRSKNPEYFDTADMWQFTFYADGTGNGPIGTGSFIYEIEGSRITLRLTNIEAYYGQTVYEYNIVNLSENGMEWDEIPNEYWSNRSLYLKFYRVPRAAPFNSSN